MKKKGKGNGKANGHADAADLRELPPGWIWVRLKDLASPEPRSITDGPFGSNLKSEHYTNAGPRVIRLENIGHGQFVDKPAHISERHYRKLERHAVTGGDLVIAILGSPLPRACVVPASLGTAIVKADCIRFKPDTALVDNRFVCWWINSKEPQKAAEEAIHGVGRPRLGMQNVKDLMVPLAPRPEQERIVAKLDELLSDIEAGEKSLERAAVLVKRYRQSVLKAAVTAELTKEWRVKNLARLKREKKTGADLLAEILVKRRAAWESAQLVRMIAKGSPPRNDKWKKKYVEPAAAKVDDLPELPDGWVWGTLGQLISWIEAGKNFRCAERPPAGREVGVVKVSAVTWGVFNELESKTITDERLVNLTLQIAPGDLLFSRANTLPLVGATVTVAKCTRTLLLSDKILRLHLADELKRWVDIALKSPFGRQQIEALATGNQESMRNITQDNICRIAIPIPPRSEIDEACRSFDEERSKSEHAQSAIAAERKRSVSLQQALLRSAFAGELVDQDPIDEPASALLKRIRADRDGAKPQPPKSQAKTKKPKTRRANRNKARESDKGQGKLL